MEHEQLYHYQLVARAIAEIDASPLPLSLEALAEKMQLSPAHLQRVFTAWAGVSPKAYQSYLSLGLAKRLLAAQEAPLLEVASSAGLSGTGRLHDLFVKWESMAPGTYAKGGAGLILSFGRFESPFGPVMAVGHEGGLSGLSFAAELGEEAALEDLKRRWPAALYRENSALLRPWVEAAFTGRGEARLSVAGGAFQIKVWEALLAIPEGAVTTYAAIAQSIGAPKAVRAVGTAVGQNPIGYLIPCHRVLRKDGGLGGYHWGLSLKRQMLAREAMRRELA